MIITCPQCSSKFNVSDTLVTVAGRKVKCSNCAHEWRVRLSDSGEVLNEELEVAPPAVMQAPSQAQPSLSPDVKPYRSRGVVKTEPRFYEKRSVMRLAVSSFVLSFILLATVLFVSKQDSIVSALPFMKSVYIMAGLHDEPGIKVKSIDCTVSENEGKATNLIELEVKLELINVLDINQSIDAIRFSVYDQERRLLGEYMMEPNKVLAPQMTEVIEGRLNRIPKETMFVMVDVGGTTEIILRNRTTVTS